MDFKLIFSLVLVLVVQTFASRCPEPRCDTDEERNTLWSHDDPYKFWQCSPTNDGFWNALERNCAPIGIKFSFKDQVCVWPEDYVDSCGSDSPIVIDDDDEPTTCGEDIPACKTDYEKNTLYAHDDVKKFWQCKPDPNGYWSPREMPCATPNWFCKDLQVCIWPRDWTKEKCGCDGGNPSTTVAPPTQTTKPPTEPTNPPTETTTAVETPTTTSEPSTSEPETPKPTTSQPPITTDPPSEISGEEPGPCDDPICDTEEQRNTLYAHADVKKFWQCKPDPDGYWSPLERPCAPGTWFCSGDQVCIWPIDWNPVRCGCEGSIIPDPSTPGPSTPEEPSTPEHTTPEHTTPEHTTPQPPITTDPPSGISGEEPGPCDEPICDTQEQRNTLYAHADVKQFWQCKPDPDGYWSPLERPCAPGTWFCSGDQVCIWPRDWDPVRCGCEGSVIPDPSTPGPSTPEHTTPEHTTPEHTTPEHTTPQPPITTDPPSGISGEEPGPCDAPICDTEEQRNTLYAHADVNQFWQCKPDPDGYWSPLERPCAPGSWFCSENQVCIHPRDWDPVRCGCEGSIIPDPSTPGPSTPEHTTPEHTTAQPPITTDPPSGISGEEPGPCDEPICETEEQRNTLYAHADVNQFWQCSPDPDRKWSPKERPCAPGTWFCSEDQVCIWPRNWNATRCGCEGSVSPDPSTPGPSTPGPSTPEHTTPEHTTPEHTTPEHTTPEHTTPEHTTPEPTTSPPDPIVDPVDCSDVPDCSKEHLVTIWPHVDPESFWQCEMVASPEGGVWQRAQRKCDKDANDVQLLFHFRDQACVHPDDWVDYCEGSTDPALCEDPKCTTPEVENAIKFAHYNPRKYYTCRAVGVFDINTCPLAQLFLADQQKCGDPCQWVNTCRSKTKKEIVRSFFSRFI